MRPIIIGLALIRIAGSLVRPLMSLMYASGTRGGVLAAVPVTRLGAASTGTALRRLMRMNISTPAAINRIKAEPATSATPVVASAGGGALAAGAGLATAGLGAGVTTG